MKKLLCGIGLLLCCGGTLSAQPEVIADPNIPIEERIQNAIERMTPEEKVRLCFGGDKFGEVVLPGVPRLGILPMYAADGPRGIRAGAYRQKRAERHRNSKPERRCAERWHGRWAYNSAG